MTKADKVRNARNKFLTLDPIKKIRLYDLIMDQVDDKTMAKICRIIIDHTKKKD